MSQGRRIITGLVSAATVAGLGYGNWMLVNETIETSPLMPPAATTPSPTVDHTKLDEKPLTIDAFSETVTRPLFYAARRPAPPPKTEDSTAVTVTPPPPSTPVAAVATPSKLRLIGTMRNGEKRHIALVQAENSSRAEWLEVGAGFGGWQLKEIAEDHIVVEASGVLSILTIHPLSPARSKTE